MTGLALIQGLLLAAGCLFFIVGTVGLLRFPDVYTRIHALTKADNLGLGLIVLALLPSVQHLSQAAKLILIWILVLAASSTAGYLIARYSRRHEDTK
ncbi:Na+/H+ antiporter subunit G [Aliidiomarina minuta]|uniref:Na+/H+ antiporter subunit G n=1 Tax=Aliidiomarina minuta TaxID=880057 RepID=A0A432W8G8_9GAMM|nr:monovalent cation/H(+) antiporter subunit G [Aliidiomarina minuta]RUO26321.1 Na+/H+ antiporter subunit G [Aliidiomarina minuta]